MITAKKYLLDIGLDEAHLPELFNDDDKSHYQITELMESYHQAKTKDLQEQVTLVRIIKNKKYRNMGMYTELIFGADLKKGTPTEVVEALKYMIGETEEKPTNFPLIEGRCGCLFRGSSKYFGVKRPVSKIWFDDISQNWALSTRSNIKNYKGEIEAFLEWIKPYISGGSGARDMYAIVTYEESDEPKIYYLHED